MVKRRTIAGRASAPPSARRTGRVSSWVHGASVGVVLAAGAVFVDDLRDRRVPTLATPPTGAVAPSPWSLSAPQWWAVLRRTVAEIGEDQITTVAAGATFFALLALVPAIGAFVSLYVLFADVGVAQKQIQSLEGVLPGGAVSVIGDQMTRLVLIDHGKLGVTFAISLLLSLWSANAGVKALMSGLNVAYEERERRGFLILNLISLALTAGATVFAIIAVSAVVVVPGLLAGLGLGSLFGFSLLRWPALLIVVAGLLSVLYRFGPARPHSRWRWITPGSLAGAVAWLAMSVVFSWYVANFGSYDRTYGSLGAMVGFMTWIWLSIIVVLAGAELNSELEKGTVLDGTAARSGRRK